MNLKKMKTLDGIYAYARQKKAHQIKKLLNAFYNEPIEDLNSYLSGIKKDSSVGLNFEYLSTWHLWNFVDRFIQKKELDHGALAKSTYYAKESNNWDFALGLLSPTFHSSISMENSAMHLGQMLYLGWQSEAKAYGHFLLEMLYGKQYKGGVTIPTYKWYVFELFCKWQNIALDKNRLRYPEDMHVYAEALKNFDTADAKTLSDTVQKLSHFHIAHSDEDVATDENGDEEGAEFSDSSYFIFPAEILAWLGIRKEMGLPGYVAQNNPLMEMEINKLPTQTITFPKDELVEQCKAKLLADNPGLRFPL